MSRLPSRKRKKQLTRREIILRRQSDHDDKTKSDSLPKPSAFRRSRNLMSRRDSHNDTGQSERQEAWYLRKKRRKLGLILAGIVLIIISVGLLLWQLTASVVIKTSDAYSQQGSQKYLQIMDSYYSTRPIERLRFLLDNDSMTNYFLENAPEIKSARMVGAQGLAVSGLQLEFRSPLVQWSSGGKVYYVDETGVTFEQNYFEIPGVTVDDQSGVPSYPGQEIINRRFLSFLGQATSQFKSKSLAVTDVVLPPGTVRQVEFKISDKPYLIKMTVDRPVEAQVEQAIQAIHYMEGHGLAPDYVDVRVNQSVFYK